MRDRMIEDLKGFRTPICEGLNAKIPYAEELADYLLENGVVKELIEAIDLLNKNIETYRGRLRAREKEFLKLDGINRALLQEKYGVDREYFVAIGEKKVLEYRIQVGEHYA